MADPSIADQLMQAGQEPTQPAPAAATGAPATPPAYLAQPYSPDAGDPLGNQDVMGDLLKGAQGQYQSNADQPPPDPDALPPNPVIPAHPAQRAGVNYTVPEHPESNLADVGETALNALTLNTAKYPEAAIKAGVEGALPGSTGTFSSRYSDALSKTRGAIDRMHTEHPGAAATLDFGIPTIATLGLGAALAPEAAATAIPAEAPTLGQVIKTGAINTVKNAGTGAGLGAVSGAAGSRNWSDVIPNALTGGATGMIFGAGVPLAAKAVSGLWHLGQAATEGSGGAQTWVKNTILDTLQKDGYTAEAATAQFNKWVDSGARAVDLLDLGGSNMARLVNKTNNLGGAGADAVSRFQQERLSGEMGASGDFAPSGTPSLRERTHALLRTAIANGDDRNFYDLQDQINTAGETRAKPYYTSAMSHPQNQSIDSPVLQKITQTDFGKAALKRAASMMRDDFTNPGISDPERTEQANEAARLGLMEPHNTGIGVGSGLKLRTWDLVKRGMDDEIGAELRAGSKNAARIHIGQKNALVNELDNNDATAVRNQRTGQITQPGDYAKGRSIWRDKSASDAALEWGKSFLSEDSPERITADMNELHPLDQQYAKVGMVRGLRDRIWGQPDISAPDNVWARNANVKEKINAVVSDPAERMKLNMAMNVYRRQAALFRSSLGGSKTALSMNDISGQEALDNAHEWGRAALDSALSVSPVPLGTQAFRRFAGWRQGATTDARNTAMGRFLTPGSEAETRANLAALQAHQASRRAALVTPRNDPRNAALGAAGALPGMYQEQQGLGASPNTMGLPAYAAGGIVPPQGPTGDDIGAPAFPPPAEEDDEQDLRQKGFDYASALPMKWRPGADGQNYDYHWAMPGMIHDAIGGMSDTSSGLRGNAPKASESNPTGGLSDRAMLAIPMATGLGSAEGALMAGGDQAGASALGLDVAREGLAIRPNINAGSTHGPQDIHPAAPTDQGSVPVRGSVPRGAGVLASPVREAAGAGASGVDAPPLKGLPSPVNIPGVGDVPAGPSPVVRRAALDYMAKTGRPYTQPTEYLKADPERGARIAAAFDAMPHDPSDPLVKASYEAMAKETMAQYRVAKKAGLKVDFIKGEDPYQGSPRMAIEDIQKNHHMSVYSTDDGYGNTPITPEQEAESPLLAQSGVKISGQPARINDIFRVVHDYFGHAKEGNGMRANGEENAWAMHAGMYSPLARLAMTTETRGQNGWLNFGPHGAANRTALTPDTVFADQKLGVLPDWVHSEGAPHVDPLNIADIRKQLQEPKFTGARGKRSAEDVVATKLGLPRRADVEDNLEAAKAAVSNMPPETGLFDYSHFGETPPVPQRDISRYTPQHGVSDRLTDLMNNSGVRDQMLKGIGAGVDQGAHKWYDTQPLREQFIRELGPEKGDAAHKRFMQYVAATSPRSNVPDNIRNASFQYFLEHAGVHPNDMAPNPYPYGHLAQNLHRGNSAKVRGLGYSLFENPKPASFVENLTGNWRPGTMDAHAVNAPAILSKDPRWLADSVQVPLGNDLQGNPVFNTISPKRMFQRGELTLEDALKKPSLWAGRPNKNEYGALEGYYRGLGREYEMDTAPTQAASWVGHGQTTGLGTEPVPFMHLFEKNLNRTAYARGEDPRETLRHFIRGEKPLYDDGGRINLPNPAQTGLGAGALSQAPR